MAGKNSIDGFDFYDVADIDIAENEIKRIKYISEKLSFDNPKGVLAVYDKMISGGIFVTPIGYEYLRTLQDYLYKSDEIDDGDVRDIPIPISYTSAMNMRNKVRDVKQKDDASTRTLVKTFRNEYKISIVMNVILIIAVIAMFIITLKADNPNMINYRTAIVNQYSEWQQELEQREAIVREKELQLQNADFTE